MKKEGIYMGKTSHMDESQVMVQMKDIVKKFLVILQPMTTSI